MLQSTSARLLEATHTIHEQILAHPFVRGISTGDLPRASFVYYFRQDYLFLLEYSRVLALGVTRAHDLELMELFSELVHETLHGEMDLHRGFAERLGISREELEVTPISPTTHAYTRHLLAVAHGGTIAELMASLLPCQWGYREIGLALAKAGLPGDPLYAEWIEMYSGPEFGELAERLRDTFDRVAARASTDELARIDTIFLASSRYEYGFWDAADRLEAWPV